jgi:hypothetical protein
MQTNGGCCECVWWSPCVHTNIDRRLISRVRVDTIGRLFTTFIVFIHRELIDTIQQYDVILSNNVPYLSRCLIMFIINENKVDAIKDSIYCENNS